MQSGLWKFASIVCSEEVCSKKYIDYGANKTIWSFKKREIICMYLCSKIADSKHGRVYKAYVPYIEDTCITVLEIV